MAKRSFRIEKSTEAVTVHWDKKSVTVRFSDLSEQTRERLLIHGLAQKLADAGAASAGTPASERWARICQMADTLKRGGWTLAPDRVPLLAEALARLKGCSADEARQRLNRLPEDQRKALEAHPAIKAEVARIRAERAAQAAQQAEAADLDDLLDL